MPREKTILGFAFYLKWFKNLPIKDHSGPIGSPVGLPTVLLEDSATGGYLSGTGAVILTDGPEPSVTESFKRAVEGGLYDALHKGHYYSCHEQDLDMGNTRSNCQKVQSKSTVKV